MLRMRLTGSTPRLCLMQEPIPSPGPHVDERGIRPAPAYLIEQLPGPGGRQVLRLVGEFDLASSNDFRERVSAALAAGSEVVLDMHQTQFIDSSMLKELLRANTVATQEGVRLVLAGVRPPVQRLFELTRVEELLEIELAGDAVSGGAAGG